MNMNVHWLIIINNAVCRIGFFPSLHFSYVMLYRWFIPFFFSFQTAHIWACPPSEGDDYIFHCNPIEQNTPKPKRLIEWYKNMLERGKQQEVIHDYKDIYTHCNEEQITQVTEIPYFEGDFWPNVIEETIKEIDQEEKERKASETVDVSLT